MAAFCLSFVVASLVVIFIGGGLLTWAAVFALIFWIGHKFCKPKQQWVNFIGADDKETCEDCRKAMAGNPWPIDEAPEPGTLKCGDDCRHALQLTSPPKS